MQPFLATWLAAACTLGGMQSHWAPVGLGFARSEIYGLRRGNNLVQTVSQGRGACDTCWGFLWPPRQNRAAWEEGFWGGTGAFTLVRGDPVTPECLLGEGRGVFLPEVVGQRRHKEGAGAGPCGGEAGSRGSAGPFPRKNTPTFCWGVHPFGQNAFFSDEKPQTNPEGKRRAAGGCGGSAENDPPKLHLHGGTRWPGGEGQGSLPKNRLGCWLAHGAMHREAGCANRRGLPRQQWEIRALPLSAKKPFPLQWPDNADRQPGPVKLQMCAISVAFLLRASALLCCEYEPSSDSGKHINACLNSSSFSKSIHLHLMDFSET